LRKLVIGKPIERHLNYGHEKGNWRDYYNAVARDSSMPCSDVHRALYAVSTTTPFPLNLPLVERIDVGVGKEARFQANLKKSRGINK